MAEAASRYFTAAGSKLAAQIESLPSDDPLKHIRNEPSAGIKFQAISYLQITISEKLKMLQNTFPSPYFEYSIVH